MFHQGNLSNILDLPLKNPISFCWVTLILSKEFKDIQYISQEVPWLFFFKPALV